MVSLKMKKQNKKSMKKMKGGDEGDEAKCDATDFKDCSEYLKNISNYTFYDDKQFPIVNMFANIDNNVCLILEIKKQDNETWKDNDDFIEQIKVIQFVAVLGDNNALRVKDYITYLHNVKKSSFKHLTDDELKMYKLNNITFLKQNMSFLVKSRIDALAKAQNNKEIDYDVIHRQNDDDEKGQRNPLTPTNDSVTNATRYSSPSSPNVDNDLFPLEKDYFENENKYMNEEALHQQQASMSWSRNPISRTTTGGKRRSKKSQNNKKKNKKVKRSRKNKTK